MTKKICFFRFPLLIILLIFNKIIYAQKSAATPEALDTAVGMIMKIKSDQSKYQPLQPIYIRITITNNTPNDIMFNKRFAITKRSDPGYKSELTFKINKPNRDDAVLEFFSDAELLAENDFIKIKSKAKYERILDITRWYWKELVKPGIYTLKCVYFNDQTGYQEWTANGYELVVLYPWIGSMESNTITFSIDDINKKEMEALISKLSDSNRYNWDERSKVAEILGELKNSSALDALINQLKSDEHDVVRRKCVEALAKFGKSAIKKLYSSVENKDPMVRILSVKVLGMNGEKKALGIARKELKNDNVEVVIEAMECLRLMDKEIAIKDLKGYINDEREMAKLKAVEMLKSLGVNIVLNKSTNKWEVAK